MRNTVLIVDDVEINRDILADMLEDEYRIVQSEDGMDALQKLDQYEKDIAIILLDLVMPKLDGMGVLKELRERGVLSHIPVLVITGESDASVQEECLSCGAFDFVLKPFVPSVVRLRVKNAIEVMDIRNNLEKRVEEQTREIVLKNETLMNMSMSVINLIGTVVEYRDEESGNHVIRVREYTEILIRALQKYYAEYEISEKKATVIAVASVLHDVGKVSIPDAILCKPGSLTSEEFSVMKEHTVRGYQMIQGSEGIWDDDYKKCTLEIVRSHHEKWDGKGYPDGLEGDQIPISAQIVALADCYDALIHKRVYKEAFSKERAFEMIQNGECGKFNPKLLDCFAKTRTEMEAVQWED